jgi:DNA-binding response OmpR family regulator
MNHGKENDGSDDVFGSGADHAQRPLVLLVEDDAVSAAFLSEAIAALPAAVVTAATVAEAERIVATQGIDLWLIDAHLPDGHGTELLMRLRAQGLDTPALAHTAETSKAVLDTLIDAGFEEVLIKPLSVAAVHGAIRRFIGSAGEKQIAAGTLPSHRLDAHLDDATERPTERPTCGKLPIWDDDTALRALNGNHAHVTLMRQLFRAELPQQAERIATALCDSDSAGLRSELHKLLASAGFVGAVRLAQTARDLQANPETEHSRAHFHFTVRDTLDSFRDQDALSPD